MNEAGGDIGRQGAGRSPTLPRTTTRGGHAVQCHSHAATVTLSQRLGKKEEDES